MHVARTKGRCGAPRHGVPVVRGLSLSTRFGRRAVSNVRPPGWTCPQGKTRFQLRCSLNMVCKQFPYKPRWKNRKERLFCSRTARGSYSQPRASEAPALQATGEAASSYRRAELGSPTWAAAQGSPYAGACRAGLSRVAVFATDPRWPVRGVSTRRTTSSCL
jgi:hypothetical protein